MALDFRDELKNRQAEENFADLLANPSSIYIGSLSNTKLNIISEVNPFVPLTSAQKESNRKFNDAYDKHLSCDECPDYMKTKKD